MPDDLLDIADGNGRLAAVLRQALESLAEHGSEQMREMAREVLGGGSLRDMARGGVYGDEVGTAFSTFWARYREMSSADRNELEEAGRHYLTGRTQAAPASATACGGEIAVRQPRSTDG